jgi:hypothetical protein
MRNFQAINKIRNLVPAPYKILIASFDDLSDQYGAAVDTIRLADREYGIDHLAWSLPKV